MKLFCLLIVVILYNLDSSDACSCIRRNPEEHFCKSEFVAIVKIGTRHQESEFKFYYDFTTEQVLRATEKGRKSLSTNRLLTTGNVGACGVFLQEGKELIITGNADTEGNAHVGLCNYHGLWSDVTGDVRTGFLGGYNCTNSAQLP